MIIELFKNVAYLNFNLLSSLIIGGLFSKAYFYNEPKLVGSGL